MYLLTDRVTRERLIALMMVPFIAAGATAFGAFGIVGSIIAMGFGTAGVVVLGSFITAQVAGRSVMLAWYGGMLAYFLLIILIGLVVVVAVPF